MIVTIKLILFIISRYKKEFLDEECLGEKYMGEKYAQEEFF
jgi:hypothetical protein